MKKRIAFRKLGRTTAHRTAMIRNMMCSLIEHERIVTTTPKAKELKRYADKVKELLFFHNACYKKCNLHPLHSLALTQVIGYAKRWANHQQLAASEHKLGNLKVAEQSAADALHQLKLANSWINQRPLLIKLLVLAHVHQYIYLYICLKFIISFFFI
jgi:hypothetical protein